MLQQIQKTDDNIGKYAKRLLLIQCSWEERSSKVEDSELMGQ